MLFDAVDRAEFTARDTNEVTRLLELMSASNDLVVYAGRALAARAVSSISEAHTSAH
jgi:hypothetical protein